MCQNQSGWTPIRKSFKFYWFQSTVQSGKESTIIIPAITVQEKEQNTRRTPDACTSDRLSQEEKEERLHMHEEKTNQACG